MWAAAKKGAALEGQGFVRGVGNGVPGIRCAHPRALMAGGGVVAAELFFEVRSAEDEGGRPAVGARRCHVARFAMREERFDLGGPQRISRLDGPAAGGQVGEFLQHLARARRRFALDGPREKVAKRSFRVRAFQERRKRVDADRARAERFDLDAQARERLLVRFRRRHLRIRQVHRDGGEAPLAFERTRFQAAHKLLEEHPLVQGVLVHDEDAVRRLGHQIGVVKLDGVGAGGNGERRASAAAKCDGCQAARGVAGRRGGLAAKRDGR